MSDETRQLAEFIIGLSERDIPKAVRERLRYLVLDDLASGLVGSHQSAYTMSAAAITALGGSGGSHIFGHPGTTDVSRASFLNGVAIGCFEADHTAGGAHPGGSVFPAIFALGASLGSTGEEMMRALVVGYEVNCRVANAQTNAAEQVRGFHNPGISGPFAAAAGCAVLLKLSLDETLNALGIAGSHSAGLIEYVWTGAMTKRIHEGRGAQMGLESALLAQRGLTGPPTIFEGEYGYLQAFSPQPVPANLIVGLGSTWTLEEVRVKPYPGHGTAQPFIPVLDDWRAKGIDPYSVERIEITTSEQGTEERFHELHPISLLGAQYSLPFMIAVAITRGIDGCIELNESVLDDDALPELASRVHIEEGPEYKGNVIVAGGELVISTATGREVINAAAIPRYNLDELRRICRGKLERYSRGQLDAARVSELENAVEHLEELGNVAELDRLVFSD